MDLYLGRIAVPGWARLVSRLIGPFFLRSFLTKPIGATPRNIGTMPAIKARPDLDLEFASERTRFLDRLAEVEALDGEIQHAMYGAMKADDARRWCATTRRTTSTSLGWRDSGAGLGPKRQVSCIAQPWHDVAVLVEVRIDPSKNE